MKKVFRGEKMKKFLLLLIFTCLTVFMFAEIQNIAEMEKVANQFILAKNNHLSIENSYPILRDQNIYGTVFNLKPVGFIAISSDTKLPPVVAYSWKNGLKEKDRDENLFYEMIAADMKLRLDYYQLNPVEAQHNEQLWQEMKNGELTDRDFQQWPPQGATATDGWVETRWNQSGVYNQLCPLDNGGQRSVVGCVATAMAMIVDYHKFCGDVSFSNSDDYYSGYSWPYIEIDDDHAEYDFPTFPELNNYLDDLKDHYQNGMEMTSTDKAALSFACGISTYMNYSSDGSGTQTSYVANALRNKFDFDSATYIENYGTSFYNSLQSNMIAMKPAEISIFTSGWNNGHAIICDGYNTDDYYHLNFGWGTSNSSCWYILPEGMPNNYSIISGGVVDIEGGATPIQVSGLVNVSGTSPMGAHVTFVGDTIADSYVEGNDGGYNIPAMWPGTYQATAILEDRFYYQTFEVTISSSNNFIQFNLDEYDGIDGTVTGAPENENSYITLYQDNEITYSGISDENGTFFIPEVFPGIYTATASAGTNCFEIKEVEISAENQNIQFNVEPYDGSIAFSFASHATGTYELVPDYTIGCAIKLTEDDWIDNENDVLGKIRFLAPIDMNEGEIKAQIWQNNDLLHETEVTEFYKGKLVEAEFTNFYPYVGNDYYIGYEIHSTTGVFAYHDNGPRIDSKGAYIRTTNWTELPASINDFNFCIEPVFLSQEYGTISGNVTLHGSDQSFSQVAIATNNMIGHPDSDGTFYMDLKPGIYDLSVSHHGYETVLLEAVEISFGSPLENIIIDLYSTENDNSEVNPITTVLFDNYPNPFNPETTISYQLGKSSAVNLSIYNLKGQKIKTLVNEKQNADTYQIVWDGKDQSDHPVANGIYMYRLQTKNQTISHKMLLLK